MNPYAKAFVEIWGSAMKTDVDKWLNGGPKKEAVMECICVQKGLPKRCRACNGYFQLEEPMPPIQLGDIVEWAAKGTQLAVVQAIIENGTIAVVILTGPRKGDTDFYPKAAFRAVHGYIHIDRGRADTFTDHYY